MAHEHSHASSVLTSVAAVARGNKRGAKPKADRETPVSPGEKRYVDLAEWRERFTRGASSDLGGRLAILAVFGVADVDLAKLLPGTTPRSIRRWRTDGVPTAHTGDRWDRVDDLWAVIRFLLGNGTLEGNEAITRWLRTRSPYLSDRRPLSVLAEGGFDEVREAAIEMLHELPAVPTEALVTVPTTRHAGSQDSSEDSRDEGLTHRSASG